MAKNLFDLESSFGKVSFGDKTASCRVDVALSEITLVQAHKNLCERRLTGQIVAKGQSGDHADQATFPGMEDDVTISGIFDVSKISVSSKSVGFTASFSLRDMDRSQLSAVANRNGRLKITGVEEIPEKEKATKAPVEADEE